MDENTCQPGYYAVIPADVRYDDSIPANAKLLYGEISALVGSDGFCFASNQYFADLYGCTPVSVARLITKLESAGHIRRELEKDESGQVVRRKLYLSVSAPDGQPVNKIVNTPQQNCGEGINKNVKYTNTSITDIYKENKKEKSAKKTKASVRSPKEDFNPGPLFVDWIAANAEAGLSAERKNALYLAMVRFSENRIAIKKPMKSKAAVTALCNKLMQYSHDSQDKINCMIDLLDTATSSGWQSVYPPKQQQEKRQQQVAAGGDDEWL